MDNKKPVITLRLKPDQEMILNEVSEVLGVPKSVFVRAVIGDWLIKNEDCLYRLIDNKLHNTDNDDTEQTDIFAGAFDDDN